MAELLERLDAVQDRLDSEHRRQADYIREQIGREDREDADVRMLSGRLNEIVRAYER